MPLISYNVYDSLANSNCGSWFKGIIPEWIIILEVVSKF